MGLEGLGQGWMGQGWRGRGGVCDGAKRLVQTCWFYLNAHASLEYATVFFRLGVLRYKAFKGS